MSDNITIKDVRTYSVSSEGGGDYHLQEKGHWITDTYISNPMSMYPDYKKTRTSWGIGVLGSVVCIGIPNPPPSVLSNSLKEYVADKFGKENAWRYTVTQPAINSILQAMGRPIRSVDDRALILLLDKRNGDRTYTNCYPKSMKMNATNDPKTTNAFARRFFRRVKRN